MATDERLRRDLEQAGRPADPSGVYEQLISRRERRRIVRRVQAGGLALAVFGATIGGFYTLTRVFRETEQPPITAPTVSNGLIVFSIPLEGEGEALMAVAPDGSELRRLTPEGKANYRSPDVSPDGRTVVVVHEIPSFDAGQSVLATVPMEGGSPTWLTEETWHILDPVWSPDAGRIAFAGSPGGPFGIYVFDVATGAVDLVPGTDEISVGDPAWSPDGTRIAFEAWDGTQPERWDLYTVRIDGSDLTNLTNSPNESETWPAWSGIVDRIAFIRGGGAPGLYTIVPDGTDEVLVTDELPDPASPSWSPDGALLTFSADTGQVYTVRPDGAALTPVTGALGEPAWQPLPEGATMPPVPSPTEEPSPSESPYPVEDIGLGFPVCNVSAIQASFASPGAEATAFVATRRGDTGGCPDPEAAFNVVALDVDADGLADTSYGPIECALECRTFSAPDLDGDGTAELLIVQSGGSVVGLTLFDVEVRPGAPVLEPVTVDPPGDPAGGFDPGELVRLLLGGDEFFLYALRCGDPEMRHGPGLVVTAAESLPHDSPDARWRAHRTVFALVDGSLRVMDVGDFTEPAGFDPPSFQSGQTLCGSNLGP